jgi:hypothetical protein
MVAAPIALEILKTAPIERPELQQAGTWYGGHKIFTRSSSQFVAQNGRAHAYTSRVSKSMRGSIHV